MTTEDSRPAVAVPVQGIVRPHTTVNAGFSRGRGKATQWRNVTGIVIPMPPERLGDREFRLAVEAHRPEPGYALEGYCIA